MRNAKAARPGARRTGASTALLAAGLALTAALSGCAPTTLKHGYQFRESDLQQVQPGMTQDAVKLALGTPATMSTVSGGQAFYYISSTTQQVSFLKPKEVDRKVLAVYFNPVGTVERVAHYGMKDGRVFDYVKRTTPSHAKDQGLIGQLLRGLGPVNPFGGQ